MLSRTVTYSTVPTPAIRPCSQAMNVPHIPVSISRPSTIYEIAPISWIVLVCRRRKPIAPVAQPNPNASNRNGMPRPAQ